MTSSESSLPAAEIWKRNLIDNAQGAVFLIDDEGVVLEFNADAAAVFGVTKKAIPGQSIEDYLCSGSMTSGTPIWRNLSHAAGSPKVTQALDGRRADGSEFPMELRITEIAIQPRPVYLGYLRDLSTACVTETSLEPSSAPQTHDRSKSDHREMWCRSVTESLLLMTWKSNAQGVIEWSNQGWRKFTGIPLEQQAKHQWQSCIHPDDLTALTLIDSKSNTDPSTHASEFRMLRHDHSYPAVFGHVEPIRNDEGDLIGYQGVCFEIMPAANAPDESAEAVDHQVEFDHQAIRELFDHNMESLVEIAKLFENTCEESMTILETAFQQTDQPTLFNTAHRLKGAVANMNAPQVFDLCQQLETAIRNSDMLLAETLNQAVAIQVARLRTAVRKQFMN